MMKKTFLYIASAFVAASLLSSCGSGNSLAKKIEGSWQGNPQAIASSGEGIITMTDEWAFVGDDNKATGGDLIITSMASVEWPLSIAGDSIAPGADPYAVTVAATVSLNAVWDIDQHDPDDEIVVSIDPKTLSVSIDPDAVAVSADGKPATVDSIPGEIYASVRRELLKSAQTRFFPVNHLDDVEIKGDVLKFEIPSGQEKKGDVKIRLTRLGDLKH